MGRSQSQSIDVYMHAHHSLSPNAASPLHLAFLLCVLAQPIRAELPQAKLFTVFPPGAHTGSAIEVSVNGADLDEPAQLLFSSTNITAKPKSGDATRFLVTVASNAAPGVYDARFVGRFGISNPRAFVVSALPEIEEKDTNHTMASAMEILPDTIVNGHADASATDFFKFSTKKGQRILVDCVAKAIDSRMDAGLVLYDSSGRELERNRRGGLLDFTPVADGQYVLKVHDFLFRGGAEYFYRLCVSTGPRIDFIFPPAGLAGTKSKYILYGRNLLGGAPVKDLKIEGKALEQLEVEIEAPADAMAGQASSSPVLSDSLSNRFGEIRGEGLAQCVVHGFEYRLQTPQGVSNPILISFATGPLITEQEPNNKPEQAQKISLPCEVVGQFYPAGDQDRFTFEARKGEVYSVEVFSQRLGLPTSPFLLVQRVTKTEKGEEKVAELAEVYASDNNIGGREFKTSTLDPAWRFEVKEDGTYRIAVSDLFNSTQNDPRRVYRLSVRRAAPDFQLVALASPPPQAKPDAREAHVSSAFLRRGETIPVKVLAFRRDNFDGEIQLSVEGLPQGVTYPETKIEAVKNSTVLLLTAAEGSPPCSAWAGPIRVFGKSSTGAGAAGVSTTNTTDIVRQAHGATVVWNVGDFNTEPIQSRLTDEMHLALSGTEAAPISIAADDSSGPGKMGEAKAGAKSRIPLRVTRRGDFSETLKLKAIGIAALDSMKEIEVDGKATNATVELDLSQHKVPPGTHTLYFQAQTKGKYRNNPEAAQAAEQSAKEAEKTATELTAATKQATEAVTAAAKAVSETEAASKAAAEKLVAAKSAEEKAPDKQDLADARIAAEKAVSEASAKAGAAAEAKAAAEKTAAQASTKAKDAEATKTALASRAKELTEKAKPREVTVTVYSAPIRLKVITEEKKVAAREEK